MRTAETAIRQSHWRELLRSPALMIWALSLLLTPVHVVRSGMPQPGDWLIVLLVPLALIGWRGSLEKRHSRMLRALMWFTLWVFAVNYAWALILWKWNDPKNFILHPFFYFFNAAVFLCSLILARRRRELFLRITVDAVFITIVVLLVASFVYHNDYRGQVFFDSPNQLGYYALLSACLFAMTQRPLGMSRVRVAVAITCCAYLAVLSASRAAVAGISVLLLMLVFSNPRTIIIASLAAIGIVSIGGPVAKAIEVSQERVEHGQDARLSFSEERGYDRIWKNPEFLITGAGEGAYERFVGPGEHRRELHSSFGTIVFGYGVVGVVLFLIFAIRAVRGAPLRLAVMLVPALIFTVAHQGLRFTMFWVVLAAFVILKSMPDLEKQSHVGRLPARP